MQPIQMSTLSCWSRLGAVGYDENRRGKEWFATAHRIETASRSEQFHMMVSSGTVEDGKADGVIASARGEVDVVVKVT